MKTPFSDDLRSFRLCNPPAEKQQSSRMWPAISRRSYLGFRNNLMSIPIYPIRPYLFLSSAKIMQTLWKTKQKTNYFSTQRYRVTENTSYFLLVMILDVAQLGVCLVQADLQSACIDYRHLQCRQLSHIIFNIRILSDLKSRY